jgi:hypothetical protein
LALDDLVRTWSRGDDGGDTQDKAGGEQGTNDPQQATSGHGSPLE